MKIIVVESALASKSAAVYNKNGDNALDIQKECPRVWFKADSALLTHGKPVFVPEFTKQLSAAPYLALRICRMGKSIPARFAYRYYDAASVAVDFTAQDVLRELRAKGEPWDMAKSFDGSVCIGREIACASLTAGRELTLTLLVDGEPSSTTVISDLAALAGRAIEQISRFFTLRQGDWLLIGKPDCTPLVKIGSHIAGTLEGEALTEFNIK